jgi:hypothetical protein
MPIAVHLLKREKQTSGKIGDMESFMNFKRLYNEKLRIDSRCRSSALPPSE